MTEKTAATLDELRQAFALLATAESGTLPNWSGPNNAGQLRSRIELLAILLDIVPRAEVGRLDEAITAWVRRFAVGEPVSASQLKEVTRGLWGRSKAGDRGATAQKYGERALAIVKSHPDSATVLQAADLENTWTTTAEAERLCAIGLQAWFNRLDNDLEWTHVRGVGLAEQTIEIDKLYVELFAIADQDIQEARETAGRDDSRRPWRAMADRCPVVSAATMLARVVERCVVVGEPGSGKSTLVQWIARAVLHEKVLDFELAVVIRLNYFASALERRPTLSLVEFFFETLEAGAGDWGAASEWLRRVAECSGRCLMLLDGWDEVPVPQREAVARRIDQEERFFTTLITTRPLAMPGEFQENRRTDVYHLAGLTPRAIEELVRNLLRGLGRMDLCGMILQRIAEPDLREMAANPFLLGLLVRVLVHPRDAPLATRADVYHQVVAWIQQQHDESKGKSARLTGGHVAGLRSLSHWLLFEADYARYLFRLQELADRLGALTPEPVLRSRLVNCTEPSRDEYSFLHATFQEYFAAAHAATLAPEAADAFLDRAMRSASRIPVVEFAAGLDGLRPRCQAQSLRWLDQQDRFGQVLWNVARLAVAGRWPAEPDHGVGQAVRGALWYEIETNGTAELWQAAAEALAELDPDELCRLACERTALPLAKILFIAQATPASVAAREEVLELVPAALRDAVRGEAVSATSNQDIEVNLAILREASGTVEERWKAIVLLGAVRERRAVPDLIAILSDANSAPMLWQQAIDSLAKIGGRQAVDVLVDLVTGRQPLSHDGTMLAVDALRHVANGERALDAIGRDRILRRIAMLPLEQPAIEHCLAALEGFPLRDGAELVAAIAVNRGLSAAVRRKAIDVMKTVVHRRLVESLVQTIESEPDREVSQALLNLGDNRHVPIPITWLMRQIQASQDRLQRRRLLISLVRATPEAKIQEKHGAWDFLQRRIAEALAGEQSANSEEVCKALVAAFAAANRSRARQSLPESTALARQVLENFVNDPGSASEGRFLLAVAVVEFFDDERARELLRDTLQKVLKLARPTEDARRTHDRMAHAICAALARVAPAELLMYSDACEPVQVTLRSWAIRLGWLVFDNRIVDAEGREVCRLGDLESDGSSLPGSPELRDMLKVCAKTEQNAFLGYWFMVTEGGPCQPRDDLGTIYEALQSLLNKRNEEIRDDQGKPRTKHSRGQGLGAFGISNLATFSNWKKYLHRARTRIEKKLPSAIPQLRDLGLYRKSRR